MSRAYREGTIFAVPLRTGGHALGVIARESADNSGGILGYFFSKKLEEYEEGCTDFDLQPTNALRVLRFGDLSLLQGEWKIIGNISEWNRAAWPMPDFVRKDDLSKKAWRVRYSEEDICKLVSEQPEPYESKLERDAIFGSGAVELILTKLID